MRRWGALFLCIAGLFAAGPVSLHAAPETTLEKLFNPSFSIDVLSPRFTDGNDTSALHKREITYVGRENDDGIDQYLDTIFSYLNRKLGFTEKDVSLRPMIGIDIFRTFSLSESVTFTPEIYAVYRHEDSDSRLTPGRVLQAGMGFAIATTDRISSRLSFDSDLQSGARDHRAVLSMNYRW